jgi:hypothetical protein
MEDVTRSGSGIPGVADRGAFEAELDPLRAREKAHTREGDAIAAARRRLPMVEVDPTITVLGARGPVTLLDVFEGRRQLIAYYFMWHMGRPAALQCEGCTWVTTQVAELSYLHSRDITFAVLCQGPYDESARYRDFMGWKMPWYSAQGRSLDALLTGRKPNTMYLMCYLRQGAKVFETYWTSRNLSDDLAADDPGARSLRRIWRHSAIAPRSGGSDVVADRFQASERNCSDASDGGAEARHPGIRAAVQWASQEAMTSKCCRPVLVRGPSAA